MRWFQTRRGQIGCEEVFTLRAVAQGAQRGDGICNKQVSFNLNDVIWSLIRVLTKEIGCICKELTVVSWFWELFPCWLIEVQVKYLLLPGWFFQTGFHQGGDQEVTKYWNFHFHWPLRWTPEYLFRARHSAVCIFTQAAVCWCQLKLHAALKCAL